MPPEQSNEIRNECGERAIKMQLTKKYIHWIILIPLVLIIYGGGLKMFPPGFDEIRFESAAINY